ncbi:unnamed protein product [Phaeothamnion confervicola]
MGDLENSKFDCALHQHHQRLGGFQMAGFLQKSTKRLYLGRSYSNFVRRWFVLKHGCLCYYDSDDSDEPRGVIFFDEDTKVYRKSSYDPLQFRLDNRQLNMHLRADTGGADTVAKWMCAIHRALAAVRATPRPFGSFAPIRAGNRVTPLVDGAAHMAAVAQLIDGAAAEVLIAGWWVCPDILLTRGGAAVPTIDDGRTLRAALRQAADRGVVVCVIMYREIGLALPSDSAHQKQRLTELRHPNINVIRHPYPSNAFRSEDAMWSHHEKLVVVDRDVALVGGIDLCFGRWDTPAHVVAPPLRASRRCFPGLDFYNPRRRDFCQVAQHPAVDIVSRKRRGRMPWHDVHCRVEGPAARDIARHLIERWDFALINGISKSRTKPYLLPLAAGVTLACRVPGAEGAGTAIGSESTRSGYHSDDDGGSHRGGGGSSEDEDGGGTSSSVGDNGDDDADGSSSMGSLTDGGEIESLADIDESAVGPTAGGGFTCDVQALRSSGMWSLGLSKDEASIAARYAAAIEAAEHFVYIENQFFVSSCGDDGEDGGDDGGKDTADDGVVRNTLAKALLERLVRAFDSDEAFRVVVLIPAYPCFDGDASTNASIQAVLFYQLGGIRRLYAALRKRCPGIHVFRYLNFYTLRGWGVTPAGSPVSEQIYIHSKILIADDRLAIIGSANINDRSMLGCRDSEVAVAVEDTAAVETLMAGRPWRAAKFAHELRVSLWQEHLGLGDHPACSGSVHGDVYSGNGSSGDGGGAGSGTVTDGGVDGGRSSGGGNSSVAALDAVKTETTLAAPLPALAPTLGPARSSVVDEYGLEGSGGGEEGENHIDEDEEEHVTVDDADSSDNADGPGGSGGGDDGSNAGALAVLAAAATTVAAGAGTAEESEEEEEETDSDEDAAPASRGVALRQVGSTDLRVCPVCTGEAAALADGGGDGGGGCALVDPLDETVYTRLWHATARHNTLIYEANYPDIPRDTIGTLNQAAAARAHARMVTPQVGSLSAAAVAMAQEGAASPAPPLAGGPPAGMPSASATAGAAVSRLARWAAPRGCHCGRSLRDVRGHLTLLPTRYLIRERELRLGLTGEALVPRTAFT